MISNIAAALADYCTREQCAHVNRIDKQWFTGTGTLQD
jgi:hypothetical protein